MNWAFLVSFKLHYVRFNFEEFTENHVFLICFYTVKYYHQIKIFIPFPKHHWSIVSISKCLKIIWINIHRLVLRQVWETKVDPILSLESTWQGLFATHTQIFSPNLIFEPTLWGLLINYGVSCRPKSHEKLF